MKFTRAFAASFLCLCLFLAEAPIGAAGVQAAASAQLEEQIARLMREGNVPGLSMAIVRKGRPTRLQGFGVRNSASKDPVTADTVFEAASLSKPVFAYAVLKLVDQGKLSLDAPLSGYLAKPYLENDDRLAKITARLVLSHRTGFRNWRSDDGLKIYFTPGERFSYSGEGFVYLQTVVEHITGKKLNEVMNELVFEPLGMKSSSYVWRPDYDTFAAAGHDGDGTPRDFYKPDHENAASSLHTTARDYGLFLSAILDGSGLKPATFREMETPQIAVDPSCTNCLDHAPKELSKSIFWGLGWGIQRTVNNETLWHWGDNGSYKCFVTVDLASKSAVILFTNSENGLAIAPAVFRDVTGTEPLAFTWLKYARYDSPEFLFARTAQEQGADVALQTFRVQLTNGQVSEDAVNNAGYRLLRKRDTAGAIRLLQRNTELHPQSWNAWDSLGEAYAASGDKAQAIVCYEKSLQLNPQNSGGKDMLKKLRAE